MPPYVNTTTHQVVAGTVTCSVLQAAGNSVLVSNGVPLSIAQLVRAKGAVGHVTASYLATLSQSARLIDQAYSYKQAISKGTRFQAASAHQRVNEIVTGLRPLVGGAREVELGSSSSIDLGTVDGQPLSIDNNTIIVIDALISAALVESRKALANPVVVRKQSIAGPNRATNSFAPKSTIIGSLLTITGKVISCNAPWNQLADEVSGQQSNCPSPQETWNAVAQAGVDSFREAIDSTLEDAKKFSTTVGAGIAVLAGGPGAAVVADLVETATAANVVGHGILWAAANDSTGNQDKQAFERVVTDYWKEKLNKAAEDVVSRVDKGLKDLIAEAGEQTRADYEFFEKTYETAEKLSKYALPDTIREFDDLTADMPVNLNNERDVTNSDGSNSLDTSVDTSPALDFTGKIQSSSGAPLEDASVLFNAGDDTQAPIVAGPTQMDGSYDLMVPVGSPGAAFPGNARLDIELLSDDGGIQAIGGNVIDLTHGSRNLGVFSISYDSDNDGDDDSDGTN